MFSFCTVAFKFFTMSNSENENNLLETRLAAIEQRLSDLDDASIVRSKFECNNITLLKDHCTARNLGIPLFPCLHRSSTTGNNYCVYGVVIQGYKEIHSTGCGNNHKVAKDRAAVHALKELGWHSSDPPVPSKETETHDSDSSDSKDDYNYWKLHGSKRMNC